MASVQRADEAVHRRVYIQRDYSRGTSCRFQTKFPVELENKIDHPTFMNTVNTINAICDNAESINVRTYFENCLGCLTGYLSLLCFKSHYDKCLKRLAEFVQEQNETIYIPRGLMITNPMERGLRVIEITVYVPSDLR